MILKVLAITLFLTILFTFQVNAQTFLDVWVNPIPNLVVNQLNKDEQILIFSGGLEAGEPYLNLKAKKPEHPVCILFDYAKSEDCSVYALLFGKKRYFGIKSTLLMKGEFGMLTIGPLLTIKEKKSTFGLVLATRAGYKFLIAKKIIIEPFCDVIYFWSKTIEGSLSFNVSLGINFGYRLSP